MSALTGEQIARVAHEANRAYQIAIGEPNPDVPFDEASADRRKMLAEVALTEVGATPEAQHEIWLEAKIREGYVYGLVKDTVAKTHPCLVPYAELSDAEKRKDVLFAAVVRALSG